jgi:anchored repeat ABC transporter substrate-binding protein
MVGRVGRQGRPARYVLAAAVLATAGLLGGCAPPSGLSADDDRLQVVTTTGLLRDLVRQVGGDAVHVTSLVPDGTDPHTYEPSLRDVRDVVRADVAFSNYLLLEQQGILRTLEANLRPGVPSISVAEEATKYAAEVIPLVENVALDTIWLGLRAHGDGVQHGASRTSDVLVSMTAAEGPGTVHGYLTGTFGDTDVWFDSSDGFDAASGYRDDTARLPADAHTHLSWVFSEPGRYELTFEAQLQVDRAAAPIALEPATMVVAVGVDPRRVAPGRQVLDGGHADVTADLDLGRVVLIHDAEDTPHSHGDGHHHDHDHDHGLDLDDVVVTVPPMALTEVPADEQFAFLGRPGTAMYQLPQAVLGRHIHGQIDPHLWHDVRNAMAYVELIRDQLVAADPAGAASYHDRAARYIGELEQLDDHVRSTLARIPAESRFLVTTHASYAYLAAAYGIEIAGFVTSDPASEPSLAERRRLTSTVRELQVPAVFLEPNLAARSSTLTEVAREQDVAVCPIYGDTLDDEVTTYSQLMRFNAASLHHCLSGAP